MLPNKAWTLNNLFNIKQFIHPGPARGPSRFFNITGNKKYYVYHTNIL